MLRQQIAESDAVLPDMLATAHVMEDGRRVFKSEDGSFVIDEHGERVGRDELDFDLVDGPTTAEELLGERGKNRELYRQHETALDERRQLHDAQATVDGGRERSADARARLGDARERVAEGGLSVQDIEDLDAELEEAMPSDLPTLPLAACGSKASFPRRRASFRACSEN